MDTIQDKQNPMQFQSSEEVEEIMLQELESLFDKPFLIPVQVNQDQNRSMQSQSQQQQQQPIINQAPKFEISHEKDYTNTFLITNPYSVFKVFSKDQFLQLPESSQCIIIDRLDDILQKCSHNSLILTDHIVLTNVTRLNQQSIQRMVKYSREKHQSNMDNKNSENQQDQSIRSTVTKQHIPDYDIVLLIIQLCLKLSTKKQATTRKLVELIKKLTYGKRFLRCHIEYIYQYLKVRCAKLCKEGNNEQAQVKLNCSMKILANIYEQRFEVGPSNYFYFSGYLSGIQVNTKQIQTTEFIKGFTACLWFYIHDNQLQDDRNLPVIFNVFYQGSGGFECYLNDRKLFYRILGKTYTPPTVESNGILIGEFQPKKWYFLATEHDRPSFTRPQFTAIINDKQMVNLPLDYPKIEKNSKLSMMTICKNFVGQMSSFMIFKEPVNNPKKIIHIYHNYEFGFYNSSQLQISLLSKGMSNSGTYLNTDIFDSKITDKLFILYNPERSNNKNIYDCIEMRDSELMINSGVCHNGQKAKLFFTGGLVSFLPLIEIMRAISAYNEGRPPLKDLDSTFNDFLRIINSVISSRSLSQFEQDEPNPFFNIMFYLLNQLPSSSVNNQTIQLLAEIRFQIGDSKLQEQFFKNLLYSSDFWINTQNFEVINEFWLFVKAIFAQNPIQYNKLFSIQNLIDLMVKISDIKDAGYCCEYHKNTFLMFYQGQVSVNQNTYGRSSNISGRITKQRSNSYNAIFQSKSHAVQSLAPLQEHKTNTHNIDKYLAPIAGVLEGVLTSGGSEVLEQIQSIAKSLTVKSSPCFHLQMLKLLKVLLLDSRDGDSQHCASPSEFAAQFLKANGLQILLYLCSNSSFDVKAMCVKLIDVLSSHTQLIKMAIDPDVITYMCNIILPRQMMEMATIREKSQIYKNIIIGQDRMLVNDQVDQIRINQYEIMEDEEMADSSIQEQFLESQSSPQKQQRKFGAGLFLEDEDNEMLQDSIQEDMFTQNIISGNNFSENFRKPSDDIDADLLPGTRAPPPAPRSKSKPTMSFGFDDEDDDEKDQVEIPKNKFNQTSKAYIFGKAPVITEENEEEDEEVSYQQSDKEVSKRFGIIGFKEKAKEDDKKQFMNTQKLPSLKQASSLGFGAAKKGFNQKKLALDLQDDDDNDKFEMNNPKSKGSRNTFSGVTSFDKKPSIKFAEFDDEIQDDPIRKKQSQTSFANENIMSKSNLREPKQFNFGLPSDSEEDEEMKQDLDEEQKVEIIDEQDMEIYRQSDDLNDDALFENNYFNEQRGREEDVTDQNEFLIGGIKKGSSLIIQSSQQRRDLDKNIQSNDQSTVPNLLAKRKNLMLGGNTGATSDTLMADESHSLERTQQQNTQDQIADTQEQQESQIRSKPKKAVVAYQKSSKLFTNTNNKLNLDTDAINDLFTYGGENGQVKMSEDEEVRIFESEIEELASMCIAAMNRKTPKDPIKYQNKTKLTFESKFLQEDEDSNEQFQLPKDKKSKLTNPRAQFMTPQSVRGIKKIEFQMSQDEKNAILEGSKDKLNFSGTLGSVGLSTSKNFGLKSGMFAQNTITEEMSPNSQSKSSSSKQDLNFGLNSQTSQDLQNQLQNQNLLGSKQNKKVVPHQSFNQTQPNLGFLSQINSQIQAKKRNSDDVLLYQDKNMQSINQSQLELLQNELNLEEESDEKYNDEYTVELENLYTSCLEWIISRAPSTLYENIVIDEVDKIGYQPAIQLLMVLVAHSNNIIRQRAFNDLELLTKWDPNNGTQIMMHPQFHQWLLELLMPYQDLSTKYQNLQGTSLAVYDIGCKLHTLLLRNTCTNPEEEAYKKLNFLIRWPQIIKQHVINNTKDRNDRDYEISNKLVRVLSCQLIQGLRDDASRLRPQIGKHMPTWQNLIYLIFLCEEMIFGSHQRTIQLDKIQSNRDLNGSLYKWIQREFLYNYSNYNEKIQWAEWDLIEQIFLSVECIYPEWVFTMEKNKTVKIEDLIFSRLEKKGSADEFSQIVDILLHEGSPYKNDQQTTAQPTFLQKQSNSSKAKGLLRGVLGGGNKSHQEVQLQTQDNLTQNQSLNVSSENSFMKTVLNLMCVTLVQCESKQQVQLMLERFERFVKFLMIVSESWKSRLVNTLYNNYQKKFTESISFAFSFLFHEIHNTNQGAQRHNSNFSSLGQSQGSNTSSPKDQVFNKLYAQVLKNLMIYYINIIEYQQLKQNSIQNESHISACRCIFMNVLLRNYQGNSENLLNIKDIMRIKQNDYDDFPENFYMDDWKVTFFYGETIRNIVKKQLSDTQLMSFVSKRYTYALHYIETLSSIDKTKDEILKRMQQDTIEVIGTLSSEEFERKNKVALMNENFMREQAHHWKTTKQQLFGSHGVWRLSLTNEDNFLKVSLHKNTDGTRPYMNEKYSNGFQLQEKNGPLEQKVFSELDYDPSLDLFNLNTSQIQKVKQSAKKQIIITSEEKLFTNSDEEMEKDERDDDEDDLNNPFSEQKQEQIISFFSRTLTTREKISLKKQFLNHLRDHIYQYRIKTKEIIVDMKCSILKPFYQRPGQITVTSHDIIFFDDLFTPANLLQEKDNIFFFKYQKKPDDLLYKIIPQQDLKEIQRRRFLGRKTALEIFMMNNKSVLINFTSTEDREQFAKKIIRQRNKKSFNLRYYDTLEPKRILKKRELTEKWMQWKISNFEYITQINQLGGRSYNDLSQYPVFPWIFVDFTTQTTPDLAAASIQNNAPAGTYPPPYGFRDLNKNMQLLGTAERQAEFKRKSEDMDSFASVKERFHCGSHYSNPGIVLHYLSRLSPYIDAWVELHGKNLDTADRGFYSIQESLNSALTDHADVRELIPEFYFQPEMFKNLNKIKYGVKQDGTVVNHVQLPAWCNNDPYLFIIFMRESFESNYVSQNIGGWVDFIFGYKQRDQEAEKALNLFSHLTYEDGIDIDNITDQLMKQSYQEQIYNYGQTPSQLFQKNKHPQRLPKIQALKFNCVVDNYSKIKVYKPVVQQNVKQGGNQASQVPQVLIQPEAILKARFSDDQTIIGLSKDGTVTYFFWLSKAHEINPNTPFTCCEDKKRKFDNRQKQHGFEIYDRSIKKLDFPIHILHTQKCVLRGGLWGGKIAICPIEGISQDSPSQLQGHQSTVTAINATSTDKVVISGSKSGDILVWIYIGGTANSSHESNWQIRSHICSHEGMISFIHINEEMGLFLTCSLDGTANLHNLYNDKLIRTFVHPKLSPIHSAILTQTPLAACCFFSREDHCWYSYSMNGHFLEKQKEESSHIISPQVIKDSNFMDKLVYGTEKGYIIFRQLPLLKQFKKQQVSTQYPVLSIIVSPERRFLLVGCGDGGLNVVTEPFQISQIQSQAPSQGQSSQIQSSTGTNISTQSQTDQSTHKTLNQSIASSFISMTQTSSIIGSQISTQEYQQQQQHIQSPPQQQQMQQQFNQQQPQFNQNNAYNKTQQSSYPSYSSTNNNQHQYRE